ncbi:MAG TPA: 2Fe-2S iron-sulfur cluster-binding protein [Agriterribacter sp.]|nr:2Fe-2S iron-sulfur cluster-binding protein [Agriterribacter sp.]
MDRKRIYFTAYCEGEEFSLQTYEREYRSLMALLNGNIYIEDFGECKGMGRCGTCIVKIEGLPDVVNIFDRNEERTLSKAGITQRNFRLACQVLIDKNLENVKIEVIGDEIVG